MFFEFWEKEQQIQSNRLWGFVVLSTNCGNGEFVETFLSSRSSWSSRGDTSVMQWHMTHDEEESARSQIIPIMQWQRLAIPEGAHHIIKLQYCIDILILCIISRTLARRYAKPGDMILTSSDASYHITIIWNLQSKIWTAISRDRLLSWYAQSSYHNRCQQSVHDGYDIHMIEESIGFTTFWSFVKPYI